MDNPIRKISVAKIAGNLSDVAVWALEVYKIILSAKTYAVDGVIKTTKAVKSGAGKLAARSSRNTAPVAENPTANKNDKENTSMKKSTFWSLIAFVVAVCAAVAGVLYYLKKREAELEEYDDMLFNEDYLADYLPKDEEECCDDCCCEEHHAEEDSISF